MPEQTGRFILTMPQIVGAHCFRGGGKGLGEGALGGRDGTLPSGKAAKCWSGDGRGLSQKVGGGRGCSVDNNADFQKACRGH